MFYQHQKWRQKSMVLTLAGLLSCLSYAFANDNLTENPPRPKDSPLSEVILEPLEPDTESKPQIFTAHPSLADQNIPDHFKGNHGEIVPLLKGRLGLQSDILFAGSPKGGVVDWEARGFTKHFKPFDIDLDTNGNRGAADVFSAVRLSRHFDAYAGANFVLEEGRLSGRPVAGLQYVWKGNIRTTLQIDSKGEIRPQARGYIPLNKVPLVKEFKLAQRMGFDFVVNPKAFRVGLGIKLKDHVYASVGVNSNYGVIGGLRFEL
jgi:hypothetical protein